MKCAGCGAPLSINDEVCEYCGTVTPLGERIRNEVIRKVQDNEIRRRQEQAELRRRIIEKLTAVHKTPLIVISLIYILTFGFYSHYWYCRWSGFIDLLSGRRKTQLLLSVCYALMCAAFFLLPGFHEKLGMTYETGHFIWSLLPIGIPVMSCWMAFRVRKILRNYAEMCVGRAEAERIAAPSGIALVIFGPLYLQYAINIMIDANIFTADDKF